MTTENSEGERILNDFRATFKAMQSEALKRNEMMAEPSYIELQKQIEELQERQKAMLFTLPDSREEHEMDKKEMIKYMQDNGLKILGEFRAKTRAKRSVDTYQVLKALDGDIDALMIVCNVTQVALDKFKKENPSYRVDLSQCIKDEGYTVTDIEIAS